MYAGVCVCVCVCVCVSRALTPHNSTPLWLLSTLFLLFKSFGRVRERGTHYLKHAPCINCSAKPPIETRLAVFYSARNHFILLTKTDVYPSCIGLPQTIEKSTKPRQSALQPRLSSYSLEKPPEHLAPSHYPRLLPQAQEVQAVTL